jgi:hypothetical protein
MCDEAPIIPHYCSVFTLYFYRCVCVRARTCFTQSLGPYFQDRQDRQEFRMAQNPGRQASQFQRTDRSTKGETDRQTDRQRLVKDVRAIGQFPFA